VPTPIPHVTLLVSDNPATSEPRRVRTSNDGTVELKLRPGSYTVESDQPVAFGGNAYTWTQMISVAADREAVLDLNGKNAEIEPVTAAAAPGVAAPIQADSATVLAKWQDSVVEIWTPIVHASGFVIDAARGLIATSQRAIGGAIDVEIEMLVAGKRSKVPGRVVHEDRLTGAAIVRIDPQAIGSIPAVPPGCAAPKTLDPRYRDAITAIVAPMLSGKELADGEVNRVTSQAIFVEMRLVRDAAGGPVFSEDGELLGISAIADADARRGEVFVVPVASLCDTLAAAEKKLSGPPPAAIPLPVEPARTREAAAAPTGKKPPATAPSISASNFDIRLITPDQLREYGNSNPLADVANWNDYVRDVPPVLLIRVSPQFEESFWKMIARGAASTQGMNLPPLKSFTSNFLRMRAFCGDAEVTPIHPLIIERPVPDHAAIREGLYVFDADAFGPKCGSVKLALYSEKEPNKPDTRTIDPKLFQQVTKPLQ
jgi:S1-C subfamily serine protease